LTDVFFWPQRQDRCRHRRCPGHRRGARHL